MTTLPTNQIVNKTLNKIAINFNKEEYHWKKYVLILN